MGILALLLTAVSVGICYLDWSESYARANEALEMSINEAADGFGAVRVNGSWGADGAAAGGATAGNVGSAGAGDAGNAEGADVGDASGAEGTDVPISPDAGPSSQDVLPGNPAPDGGREPALDGRPDRSKRPNVDIPVASYLIQDAALVALPGSTGLLTSQTQEEAAEYVADAKDGMGTIADLSLVYLKVDRMDQQYVAFADSSILDGWKTMAITLGALELIVLVVFFAISVMFSRWALRPVQEAWDKQRQFISNASHELKTPISIVSANTSILLDEPDMPREERKEWLSRSEHALCGMRDLVDDMLELASVDEIDGSGSSRRGEGRSRGRVEAAVEVAGGDVSGDDTQGDATRVDTSVCDLSRVVSRAVLQFESVSYERGFTLEDDVEPGVQVRAEEANVKRVLDILLDNACKYVDAGGKVSVELRSREGGAAQLSVTNTGSYIPPEKRDQIFDRFYRDDEARSRGEGYGLGLAIARGIVGDMGAQIEVESSQNPDATTFSLLLEKA